MSNMAGNVVGSELMELNVALRTQDTEYGKDYWDTLDGGAGYQDSVMWEDIAHCIKEVFGYNDNNEDIVSNQKFIDIGCAYGFLVKHLRRRGYDAWGADFSQYALDNGIPDYLRHIDITILEDEPFWGWRYFNGFSCFETMEHIQEDRVVDSIEKISKMVTSGSLGVFSICTEDQPGWDSDPTHVCIKSYEWWAERLSAKFALREDLREAFKRFHLFKDHKGIFVVEAL